MKPYSHHIFVCLGKRCVKKGSEELLDALKKLVKKQGLKERVKISRSGCLKACKETDKEGEFSPFLIVYPDGVWYKNVRKEDLLDILKSHTEKNEPAQRLVYFINPKIIQEGEETPCS